MVDINKIIKSIDEYLDLKKLSETTPVEVGPYLDRKGILKDSNSKPGLPLRKLLRKGIIPHAYQAGVKWKIPKSKRNLRQVIKTIVPKTEIDKTTPKIKINKLSTVKELIVKLLIEKYNKVPKNVFFEYKPEWLLSYPSKEIISKHPELEIIYSTLSQNKFDLLKKIKLLNSRQINQKQSFDIWIGEPYNFAIEFDEKQHFNQFRKITFNHYENLKTRFPINFYKELNKNATINAGKSGFTKLKSNDPLFLELLEGENQDNRIRQRAFRDFLKDLLPITNGYNPTLRIPYQIMNNQIKNFNNDDMLKLKEYLTKYKLI